LGALNFYHLKNFYTAPVSKTISIFLGGKSSLASEANP